MKTQQVLVTGGAGYIGMHTVVELVKAGMEPVIVDDLSRSTRELLEGAEKITGRKLIFYQVDCKDMAQLSGVFQKHPGLHSAIHFAAFKSVNESMKMPLEYYQNNLGSTITLLSVMEKFSVRRLVFSSSCTVYGQPDRIPVTEDAPFKKAESVYGETKQMCEKILQDFASARTDWKIISLRYFNPIGAHPSGLIGELPIGVPGNLVPYITQTAIGKREKLTIFGGDYNTEDGTCLRDYIHIVDLATAHVSALNQIDQAGGYEAINLGIGKAVSVLALVKAFIKVTGVNLPYVIGPRRSGDIEKVYADPDRARKFLHWTSKLTIEDALRDAWNWEQKHNHASH